MLNKRHLLAGFALTLAATPFMAAVAPVAALDKAPFDAKTAGKPILVEVTAPWCPTCKAQAPILARLSSMPKFKEMVRFNIDFDTQKDLLRQFNVRVQSTMIAFKGKQEVGRSSGDTNPDSIERLLEKSI
jgi:thiol-disulfide isomerase/thioredoxin